MRYELPEVLSEMSPSFPSLSYPESSRLTVRGWNSDPYSEKKLCAFPSLPLSQTHCKNSENDGSSLTDLHSQ